MLGLEHNFIEPRSLAEVNSLNAPDLLKDVWRKWRSNGGCLSGLISHAPHLILSDSQIGPSGAPRIRAVGFKTPAAELFGSSWSTKIQSTGLTPIREWDRYVAEGYQSAAEGVPTLDTINFVAVVDGTVCRVLYERLLFPVDVRGENVKLIACAAHVRELNRLGRLQ